MLLRTYLYLQGGDIGVAPAVASLLDQLSINGLPNVVSFVFANEFLTDSGYSQSLAAGVGTSHGTSMVSSLASPFDRLRLCAAQLLRVLLVARPQVGLDDGHSVWCVVEATVCWGCSLESLFLYGMHACMHARQLAALVCCDPPTRHPSHIPACHNLAG